ncbi:MAG: SUF system Fe-S cluster assembly regulator [Gammaproteobacteria bacterium]
MLRMSKLTDYGTVVLTCLADQHRRSAADVAVNTRLAVPTVSKLLKALTRAGLVVSHRGPHGGYELARKADEISAAEILDALEGGPLAITECSSDHGHCGLKANCHVGHAWRRINYSIRQALDEVSLAELAGPTPAFSAPDMRGRLTLRPQIRG